VGINPEDFTVSKLIELIANIEDVESLEYLLEQESAHWGKQRKTVIKTIQNRIDLVNGDYVLGVVFDGCNECGVSVYIPWVCNYCGKRHCSDHRLPENHHCSGENAIFSRKEEGGGRIPQRVEVPKTGLSKSIPLLVVLLILFSAGVGGYFYFSPNSIQTGVSLIPEIIAPTTADQEGDLVEAKLIEKAVVKHINVHRKNHQIGELKLDVKLSDFSRSHSVDMVENNYLSIVDLRGLRPSDRIRTDYGVQHVGFQLDDGRFFMTGVSENVGRVQWKGDHSSTANTLVNQWMLNETSMVNVLDLRHDHNKIAVGCVQDKKGYYTCTLDLYRSTTKQKTLEPLPRASPTPTPTPSYEDLDKTWTVAPTLEPVPIANPLPMYGFSPTVKYEFCSSDPDPSLSAVVGLSKYVAPESRLTCKEWLNGVELGHIQMVNENRISRGFRPLHWDSDLAVIARKHSKDMAQFNYFSHTNLRGQEPSDRARAHGYNIRKDQGNGWYTIGVGENLVARAWSHATEFTPQGMAEVQVEGLMNSPGHRENILEEEYSRIGVGCSYGVMTHDGYTPGYSNTGTYFMCTQVFY